MTKAGAPKKPRCGRRKSAKRNLAKTRATIYPATPRSLAAAVQAALQRAAGAGPPDGSASKLDHVADALVTKACAGDVSAIKAVFERIDGKVTAEQTNDTPRDVVIVHTFKSGI